MRSVRQRGFTLLEVVVAFVLLALILVTAFQVFSTGLSRASTLDERSQALAIAQSRLASAGQEDGLKEGETRGESPDRKYAWSLRVTVYGEDPGPGSSAPQANIAIYRVDSLVSWHGSDGRDQVYSLSTLLVGAKPS